MCSGIPCMLVLFLSDDFCVKGCDSAPCAGFKKPKRESKEREKEVPIPSLTDSPRRGMNKQPVGNGDTASGNSSASEKVDKIKVTGMICLRMESCFCLSFYLSHCLYHSTYPFLHMISCTSSFDHMTIT